MRSKLPWHSLAIPTALMLGFYAALLLLAPEEQRISVVGVLVIGAAHLLMAWLVLRDGAGRMRMLYDGLPDVETRVHRLEQLPHNRRGLLELERQRIGGPDTPGPEPTIPPGL